MCLIDEILNLFQFFNFSIDSLDDVFGLDLNLEQVLNLVPYQRDSLLVRNVLFFRLLLGVRKGRAFGAQFGILG